jgi:hypothetical protein
VRSLSDLIHFEIEWVVFENLPRLCDAGEGFLEREPQRDVSHI